MKHLHKTAFFLIPAVLFLLVAPRLIAHEQDAPRTVYGTLVDKNSGKPITDLQLGELMIFEDNKQRPPTAVTRATAPISIVLLADSSAAVGGGGIGQTSKSAAATSAGDLINDIRAAFGAFAKQMLAANPKNEVALMEFGQASIMMVNFTSNADDITKGLTRLVMKPEADSVLLEGIMESSKELAKRPNVRRAVIAVNVLPDSERSGEPANNIMKEIAKDGATFFSASLQKGDLKNSVRGPMLEAFSDKTGGKHDVIVGQSALIDLLKSYGDILNAQYEVTYARPTGAAPQIVQWATSRNNIKIYQSKFPPK